MSSFVALLACGALPASVGTTVEEAAPTRIERWPDGTPKVEGREEGGVPSGTWTWWAEDGSFRSRVTYADGLQHGPRHEVGLDGRVVELLLERGLLVGFRTLPPDAAMPEWDGDRKVEGSRYRARVTPAP